MPSLSPQTDYDYLNFSRQKTNETIPRKWRYKKNYEINNKSILTILQTRIYQTNELKYIQNDQKSCRFYLFDFQIDNKNIWFIMVYHQTIWYIFTVIWEPFQLDY